MPRQLSRQQESSLRLLISDPQFLGKADPNVILKRIEQLRRGLEPEDEFAMILTWLGNCRLVHKLGQEQLPWDSPQTYRVPDLLAVFDLEGSDVPVLIEVKSTGVDDFTPEKLNAQKLSLPGKYRAYAQALGHPMLIAWREATGIWCLFEMSHARLAQSNYKIDWQTAVKENLLGVLAGDFSYRLVAGTVLRFQYKKLAQADSTGRMPVRIERVSIVAPNGDEVPDLPLIVPLFLLWRNECEVIEHEATLVQSFTISDAEIAEFASQTLSRIVGSFASLRGERADWQEIVHDRDHIGHRGEKLRTLVEVGRKCGIVSDVFRVVPHTRPSFL